MINWDKELEEIFNHPLLADVTAQKQKTSSKDKLITGFQQVCEFYESNNRLPKDTGNEIQLFHMLQGIRADEAKIARCRPYDEYGLLPSEQLVAAEPQPEYHKELTEEEQLDAILKDPLFDDVQESKELGLFDVPDYMRERLKARKEAEYVGKRVPCEDFSKYEASFKEIHRGLKSGKYRLVKFSIQHLKVGRYFVEDGVIGYLAALENEAINRYGTRDGRTRIIFENGTEADIKFKTLTKNLSVTGYSVQDCSEVTDKEFKESFTVNKNDVESGTVYVLRSRSTRPEIAAIKNLYKIGFTVTSVESRIANAKNEPTYLCADVEVVATWKVYNVKSSTFEALIHKLFAQVQLQVTVDGCRPKEWFIVPLNVIEQAVIDIVNGIPIKYDRDLQQLVRLNPHNGMLCLSVKQPWATLICKGIKDVENRSWIPKTNPGKILIHASSTVDRYAEISELEDIARVKLKNLPTSAIIGYVDVVGFTQHSKSVWAGGEWQWELAHAKQFKTPIPYKGKLNLYRVPEIDPDDLPETI